jgi:hypothetical protein
MSQRLLPVGWDAADWQMIDPLLARGEMPHLAGLIANGVRGNLATIYPPLSPMLWTTIATGPIRGAMVSGGQPAHGTVVLFPIQFRARLRCRKASRAHSSSNDEQKACARRDAALE